MVKDPQKLGSECLLTLAASSTQYSMDQTVLQVASVFWVLISDGSEFFFKNIAITSLF